MFSTTQAIYTSIQYFKNTFTFKQCSFLAVLFLLIFLEIQSAVLFSYYSGKIYESLFYRSSPLFAGASLGLSIAVISKPITQALRSFIGSLLALEWRMNEFNRLLLFGIKNQHIPLQEQRLQEDLAIFTQLSIRILMEVVFEFVQACSFYHLIQKHQLFFRHPVSLMGLNNIILLYVCLGTYMIHHSQRTYTKITYEKENLEAVLRKELSLHPADQDEEKSHLSVLYTITSKIYDIERKKMIQESLLIVYPGLLSATSMFMIIALTAPLVMHESLSIENYVQVYALANQLTWSLMCLSRQSALIGQWKSSCFRYWEAQTLIFNRQGSRCLF